MHPAAIPRLNRLILFLIFIVAPLVAADNPFEGAWDIVPHAPGRPFGWWLKIFGANSATPFGDFVSAYGGRMNHTNEVSIDGTHLKFVFLDKTADGKPVRLEYQAQLVDGKLEGTFHAIGDDKRAPVTWTGVRAPAINDEDDGHWFAQPPVTLFNGKDLSGWQFVTPGDTCCWTAQNGELAFIGRFHDLMSTSKFWNFALHLEFKIGEKSNSGIGIRGRYEIQIKDDYGTPLSPVYSTGAVFDQIAPSESASLPAGVWQKLNLRVVGRYVTVVLNGKTVIRHGAIEGLTAIAMNADEAAPGPILLQGEKGSVSYRNVVVTPLVRAGR
jgi:hypothetical protein